MAKKNYDYKITINFEVSGHNHQFYQTDKMIKESALQLLKQHMKDVKKSKFVKIQRNYTYDKWRKDRLKRSA